MEQNLWVVGHIFGIMQDLTIEYGLKQSHEFAGSPTGGEQEGEEEEGVDGGEECCKLKARGLTRFVLH